MNSNKFWSLLSEESKIKVEEMLKEYSGSDGVIGRIFEMYEEGATLSNCTIEEYLEDISPDEYIDYHYDMYIEIKC